jgi:hypothetical protein
MSRHVTVHDRMQQGYRYELTHRVGRDFDTRFTPELTPNEMLAWLHWAYDSGKI